MRIKKQISTGNARWPVKVKMDDGTKIWIPQQKQFNSFCQSHGCSLAAVAIALQMHQSKRKSLNTIYTWCKSNISGYTGSKLTIYGTVKAINGIVGKNVATWYPITGTSENKEKAVSNIREAVGNGNMVLVEQSGPIHTSIIIAKRSGGVWIATNGTLKKTTVTALVNGALKGVTGASNQDKWFKTSKNAAGYVIVK